MPAPIVIRRHPSLARRMEPRPDEWRCTKCFKLLGVRNESRVHLRYTHGHEYVANLPASAVCRSCGTLNELR